MGEEKRTRTSLGPPSRGSRRKRTFTVKEANAALPLVRAIVSDLVALARDVTERRHRLLSLSRSGRRQGTDPYEEELVHMETELEMDGRRILEYVEELRQLGVEAKSATEGLVDFPAVVDGRTVYLCWRLGEPEVSYWHERDAGFRGRQPVGSLKADGAGPGEGRSGLN